ncbi:MAG: hypothetical protein IIB39_05850 [Candidatus Marinimicrobia bacterium]|nr:hypothetical protein [Candidatus Neomarinimicrobiota bacterium]
MKNKSLLIILLLVEFSTKTLFGGSLSGKFGIGERQTAVSARSLGMGGVNIVLNDAYNYSRWNPAQWIFVRPVRINFLSNTNYNQVENGVNGSFTEFGGFSMGFPLGPEFVVAGGVYPLSSSNYALVQSGVTNDVPWNLRVDGSGGISTFGLGVAYLVKDNLSIGIKNDWIFGNKIQEWNTVFEGTGFREGNFTKLTSFNGSIFTLSSFVQRDKFMYALSLSLPIGFAIKRDIDSQFTDDIIGPEIDINYPVELRLGLSYSFWDRYRYALEYQRSDWSSFDTNFDGQYGVAYDILSGIERNSITTRVPFYSRIALRGGASFRKLYVKTFDNGDIFETSFSFGLGIPIHNGKENFDLGVAFVFRDTGNTTLPKEKGIIFSIGYSASEAWFVRKGR